MKAHQQKLKFHDGGLLEDICDTQNLIKAFKHVKKNQGSPGIDGITIQEFEENLIWELEQLSKEVLNWSYEPTPVKRVEIPKPEGKGVRLLGIPIIKDRTLHMSIKMVLEPIFELLFSDNSYGFRPGKNQTQAVQAAQEIVQSGKEFIVDIDLSKFFDRINHDRLIFRIGQNIPDKRVLRLIGKILRSGIITEEEFIPSEEGSVQGSPLSPLLSNIVLDELDKELEKRGLEFCRYADDCNIFARSKKAAERIKQSITKFIEKKLKLKVNEDKSKTAKSNEVKFLGMTIVDGLISISKQALKKAAEKVNELTPRGTNKTIEQTMKEINTWFTGWFSYFKMTQFPAQIKRIEARIRRRLRARIVKQQKQRKYLYRKLQKRGVSKELAQKTVRSHKKTWNLSHTRGVEQAYPNKWFSEEIGQKIFSDLNLDHWMPIDQWVKLT